MYAIMKALFDNGFEGYIRPDHGRMIWGETGRPGYGLYDRALGATYLNGLWEAIEKNAGGNGENARRIAREDIFCNRRRKRSISHGNRGENVARNQDSKGCC